MRVRLTGILAATATAGCMTAFALAAGPLQSYLVRRGEQTGFAPHGRPSAYRTARAFLASGGEKGSRLNKDAARLSGDGFTHAVVEQTTYLAAPANGGGLSWVIELGSPGSARSEQRVLLHQDTAGQGKRAMIHRFGVAGVPGATGWTVKLQTLSGTAANVLFTEGRCLLLVGDAVPHGDPAAPARAGTKAIYRRTQGSCP